MAILNTELANLGKQSLFLAIASKNWSEVIKSENEIEQENIRMCSRVVSGIFYPLCQWDTLLPSDTV